MRPGWTRRSCLQAGVALAVGMGWPLRTHARVDAPVRAITGGPSFHWFGYYDKLEFDESNTRVLCNEVTFEHRTPRPEDVIAVGYVDTKQKDRWVEIGTSRAWGWQQGCMLQWRPEHRGEVVWNDREGEQHVARIHRLETGQTRTLPRPIYALSPDGRFGVTADFARIQRMRPGYGYVGLPDPCHRQRAPEESGVWRVDLDSGAETLIFSLADAARIPYHGQTLENEWNYFNHLLVDPSGQRMVVLHRWRANRGDGDEAGPTGGFTTRLITLNLDGSDRFVLDPSGATSHFIWRDPEHVCAWTRPAGRPAGFYLLRDQTTELEPVGPGVLTQNGHQTYVPGTDYEWLLSDTYPQPETREQIPFLFHIPSGRIVKLGRFRSPPEYRGEWRCDTHPRCSRDGKWVAIDSPHGGLGRQVHLIRIGEILS